MQRTTNPKQSSKVTTLFVGLTVAFVLIDLLFLELIRQEVKTIKLLKSELITLIQQEKILASAQEIYAGYRNKIVEISSVFPNEDTIAEFLQDLEIELQPISEEYSFKFSSITPLKEQDRMYLLMNIVVKSDLERFGEFLKRIEKLPHMIHVISITAKTPEGFMSKGETVLTLKVYVQNPFSTK